MKESVPTSLVAAGNTYNPCLIVLRDKGYDIWLEKADDTTLWCARKGDNHFMAYSGPELLGVVTLWEHLGDNWNQQTPNILGDLMDKIND